MKKILIAAVILLSCVSFQATKAQVHLSVGINIGSQPDWGPVGYDHADYYYMPDIDTYYDLSAHQYVYFNNNNWIHSNALPPRYASYDIYHGYKVVVNQPTPWVHAADIRTKYASFKGRRNQSVIRDSHDAKYRNHYQGDHKQGGHDDKGHDKGHDRH
jgi:hypothetical protein